MLKHLTDGCGEAVTSPVGAMAPKGGDYAGFKLVKRGLLATAFVAALGFMTLGSAADAEARGCRGRSYGAYYGGGYYSAPVRSYYGGHRYYSGYGPRYYGPAYGYGYGRGGGFYLGGRNVAVGIGW